ncbi:hypothetical protein [Parafrankia soli]|uniref:hypothetical protein n=1 Tax=Parafrankia soli TaxID=2599596 RepID=UPI0018E302B8|nr:hypothetical protein [Parafrankia soli]
MYTRGGVDIPTRELLTFAILVALGGCDHAGEGARRGEPERQRDLAASTDYPPDE